MNIITLCGSTKFRAEFERIMTEETLKGNIVISVGLFGHEIGIDMNSVTKRMLDKMHFEKIDLSDEIFVINPGGYIGLSTCDEIYYAIATRKKVRWLETPTCWSARDFENKLIEICSECLTASCWYGEFLCHNSLEAGTEYKTIAELHKLNLEHEENWSDKKMMSIYGEPSPHGYQEE